MLPPALPTSVEGKIGYIRYSVVVHIERPLWSDQRFQEYFTVLKTLNLNNDFMLRLPLIREERKTYFKCCLLWCCTTGPLVITACIPVGGYVPGQSIELFLRINNRSDQTIQNFIIQIIKNIQYHTHANSSSTKIDKIVVKSAVCDGCPKNVSRAYTLSIVVPPVPPTDESTSNIVKVSYQLQIQGSANCFREDPILIFPIKIGTYPIFPYNEPTTVSPQPQLTVNSNESFTTSVPYPTASSFSADAVTDDIDPPTYEEAILSCLDETAFRPSYPVFRRTPSYTAKPNI
ncbi:Arrestin domain-containing protein 3 [Pseudolycoriella hygida]|uniref:Arrestin domain-containing protein 3 n=1 Tax=Pseudolycoriella hygida TaxID=35572 RepID=A0A9Q0MRA6_9DIPT|nr:Arrestin domain-containing protein 3 [Pseudolycoriella hygida]